MRVLVACEFSGTVRDAFRKRGHDAWSCDILPTDVPGPHFEGDIFNLLKELPNWDLMIAHPPCTHLSSAGAVYWTEKQKDGRQQQAIDFFMFLMQAPIKKIAVENPVGIMSKVFRKPDQIIHPYYFGDPELKRTCLWLKNLPLLKYEKTTPPQPKGSCIKSNGRKYNYYFHNGKTGYQRSKFFKGIADAMAEQWADTSAGGE